MIDVVSNHAPLLSLPTPDGLILETLFRINHTSTTIFSLMANSRFRRCATP
nr:MAG TPA: hypothetical protein [Caudoviricetes sp.]